MRLEAIVTRAPARLSLHPLVYYGIVLSLTAATIPHVLGLLLALVFGESLGYTGIVQGLSVLVYTSLLLLATLFARPYRLVGVYEAIALIVLIYILAPILSALPVSLGLGAPFTAAWFESVSGFTTVGLTVFTGEMDPDHGVYLPAPEELPAPVLWWRAALQWLGGLATPLAVAMAAYLATLRASGLEHVYSMHAGSQLVYWLGVARTVSWIARLYILFTVSAIAVLYLAGISLGDSVYHAFILLSTGGSSNHSKGLGYYDSLLVHTLAMLLMFLASEWYVLPREVREGLDLDTRAFILVWLAGGLIASTVFVGTLSADSLARSLFDTVSALSTVGTSLEDFAAKPWLYKVFIVVLMFAADAVFAVLQMVKLYRIVSSRGLVVCRMSFRYALKLSVPLFLLFYLASISVAMLVAPAHSMVDTVFETVSALANVGLSTGVTGASSPQAVKLLFIVLMLAGRLKLYMLLARIVYMHAGKTSLGAMGVARLETPLPLLSWTRLRQERLYLRVWTGYTVLGQHARRAFKNWRAQYHTAIVRHA